MSRKPLKINLDRVRVIVGLSNEDTSPASFVPNELRMRVMEYLKVRESMPAPTKETDPLSYFELRRCGFDELIDPIMDIGGYVRVSNELGLEVAPLPLAKPRQNLNILPPEEASGLALGDALETKMASAAFTKGRDRRQAIDDKLTGKKGSPPGLEKLRIKSRKVAAKKVKATRQPIEFGIFERTYAAVFAVTTSIGWGIASNEAIARSLLDASLVDIFQSISLGLIAGNAISSVLSAQLAVGRQRSVPIWVFKSLLAGPASLLKLRSLGTIDDPTDGDIEINGERGVGVKY